mmetsp:Transcript_22509/g.37607  ORF Transcript_22509/g.37607 Transcript_22509/m.37607 type:complete len:292 (+) Transcript_22509:103-978(+)
MGASWKKPSAQNLKRSKDASQNGSNENEDSVNDLLTCVHGYTQLEGPNSLNLATTLYWLGIAMEKRLDFLEAEHMFLLCIEIRCAALSVYDPALEAVYFRLGCFYFHSLKFPQAEEFFLKALDIRIANDGPEHASVAAICYLLARVNMRCNRPDMAMNYFEQSLTINLMNLKTGCESYDEFIANFANDLEDLFDAKTYHDFAFNVFETNPDRIDKFCFDRVQILIHELGGHAGMKASTASIESAKRLPVQSKQLHVTALGREGSDQKTQADYNGTTDTAANSVSLRAADVR